MTGCPQWEVALMLLRWWYGIQFLAEGWNNLVKDPESDSEMHICSAVITLEWPKWGG